jgi:hypothetical protein
MIMVLVMQCFVLALVPIVLLQLSVYLVLLATIFLEQLVCHVQLLLPTVLNAMLQALIVVNANLDLSIMLLQIFVMLCLVMI